MFQVCALEPLLQDRPRFRQRPSSSVRKARSMHNATSLWTINRRTDLWGIFGGEAAS